MKKVLAKSFLEPKAEAEEEEEVEKKARQGKGKGKKKEAKGRSQSYFSLHFSPPISRREKAFNIIHSANKTQYNQELSSMASI